MTSGTQGEALGGGWTVPTATVRIFCNVLVVKGLTRGVRAQSPDVPTCHMGKGHATRPSSQSELVLYNAKYGSAHRTVRVQRLSGVQD